MKERCEIIAKVIGPQGDFPNNAYLPLLIYKKALVLSSTRISDTFLSNRWCNVWVDSIYPFDHFHSNTHEVLGISTGSVVVQLGGPNGILVELEAQDALILPAGVAHKKIQSDQNFQCVGAYPFNIEYDMHYGKAIELQTVMQNIENVLLPATDPIFGAQGPLFDFWKKH
jgi:uncharacterized protein YjlB